MEEHTHYEYLNAGAAAGGDDRVEWKEEEWSSAVAAVSLAVVRIHYACFLCAIHWPDVVLYTRLFMYISRSSRRRRRRRCIDLKWCWPGDIDNRRTANYIPSSSSSLHRCRRCRSSQVFTLLKSAIGSRSIAQLIHLSSSIVLTPSAPRPIIRSSSNTITYSCMHFLQYLMAMKSKNNKGDEYDVMHRKP